MSGLNDLGKAMQGCGCSLGCLGLIMLVVGGVIAIVLIGAAGV